MYLSLHGQFVTDLAGRPVTRIIFPNIQFYNVMYETEENQNKDIKTYHVIL